MKSTHPTYTSLIFDLLVKLEDFRTMKQLAAEVRCSHNQASAALHKLQMYKAVDCVSSTDGLWWFATPSLDTRTKTIKEVSHYQHKRQRKARVMVRKEKP